MRVRPVDDKLLTLRKRPLKEVRYLHARFDLLAFAMTNARGVCGGSWPELSPGCIPRRYSTIHWLPDVCAAERASVDRHVSFANRQLHNTGLSAGLQIPCAVGT